MRFTAKQFGAVIIAVTLSFTNFLPIVYFQRQVLAQGVSDRRREEADKWMELGEKQLESKDYNAARESFEKAYSLYQELGDIKGMERASRKSLYDVFLLGIKNALTGDFYDKIQEEEEINNIAVSLLFDILENNHNTNSKELVSILESALEQNSLITEKDRWFILFSLGLNYWYQEDNDKATQYWEKGLNWYQNSEFFLLLLYYFVYRKKESNQAIAYFEQHLQKARKLDNAALQSTVFYILSDIYLVSGNNAEAVKSAKLGLEIVQSARKIFPVNLTSLKFGEESPFLPGIGSSINTTITTNTDDQTFENLSSLQSYTLLYLNNLFLELLGLININTKNYEQAISYFKELLLSEQESLNKEDENERELTRTIDSSKIDREFTVTIDSSKINISYINLEELTYLSIALWKLGKVEKAENILNNIMKFLAQERIKNYAGNLETQPFPSNKFGVNESEVSTILQQIYFYKKKKENSLLIAEEGRGRVFSDSIFRRLNPLSDEQVDRVNSSWDRVTNKMKETIIKLVEEMNEGTRYLFENLSPELKKLYDVSPEKLQEAENERIREVQENFGKSYIPSEVFYSLTSATYPWLNPITIEEIQQISKKTNATLVEFSILSDFPQYDVYRKYNESGDLFSLHKIVSSSKNALKNYKEETKLLIWVIKPNGEIIAREVDLQSIDAPIKDIIPELRRTIHSRGNNKDESPFQEGDTVKKKNDPYDDASYTIKSVDTEKREVHLVDLLKPLSFDEVKKVDPTVKTNLQLQTLHEILIDPIADLLPQDPNEQVIFIPHKELFLVPFPALQDKEGKYLIEKHTITTAPAIQVLDLTRKQKQRIAAQPKQDVLVVGNPTMPTSRFSSEPLASLPHAESEAKAVAQYYNTKALIGDQGTEAVIASQLANYRIIHFATHGILNQIEPLESSIVLAPDGNEDGFLTAADFLNMELNAELIVLSACDTGKGRITGDGVVGLSRSLAIAGIPSILVSLWKIDDESTKELMLEFYKNLEQGNNKAQSLRQAMLTMMKKYGVYHWGAFNLIGEAE